MKKLAQGNGNYIRGFADKISHQNGYKSMWLFTGKPILRNDRFYYLYETRNGLLFVSRINGNMEDSEDLKNGSNETIFIFK